MEQYRAELRFCWNFFPHTGRVSKQRYVVAAAHKDWLDACYGSDEIDQRDLLFQQVGRLERIARKAENAGQFSAAVGAITALNRMMALGADQKGFRGHSNQQYRR
ncbi:hypothetical protein [Synechococcus sp. RS9902]|uniref:hypothetical protein n=1 Tax=Synechococcus sp. RS9902 TaxID=221345 RepID=UPI0016480878|nr:hypothetical protein [Synechococcus sp. RS9902]QNI96506.1 hypothetical protein SynRS9902_00603 [Synechococcus sp. RS9902]